MSSLLVLQDKNNIIMASDTASSVTIDNTVYRVSDHEKKIFNINGYKVFASGQKHLRDLFITLATEKESAFNPYMAEKILKKYFLGFDEYCLEVVIAEKLKADTCLYFISSYNNFEMELNISDIEGMAVFTAGIQTKAILESFESMYIKTQNFKEAIVNSYSSNQSEMLGGSVEIHHLGKEFSETHLLPHMDIRRLNSNSPVHLIIGERIIGKLILGTQLMAEDEHGIIRIRGSLQEVFNKQGAVQVALGEFSQGKYGLRVNQGAIEIIGGLTRSNLSQEVRDTLTSADGIRGDLRLTAPLPTNLTLNGLGITATATGDPNKFARLDYRGLYAQNGAIDIRTGTSLNRGVLIDGNGIRAYDNSGTKKFDIDSSGNAMFAGTLSAATGTFSGNLSAAGGTFSGKLSAASGSFSGDITGSNGTFYGNLSAVGGTFTGTLSGVNGTFSGTLSSSTITGGTISGTTITGGTINGTTISSTGLYGTTTITGAALTNTFSGMTLEIGQGFISSRDSWSSSNMSPSGVYLQQSGGSRLSVEPSGISHSFGGTFSINASTRFVGSVDFSGATVTGLGAGGSTAVRYSSTSRRLYVDLNGVQQGWINLDG